MIEKDHSGPLGIPSACSASGACVTDCQSYNKQLKKKPSKSPKHHQRMSSSSSSAASSAESESVEDTIREEMQPLVARAYAFRKYVTKWIKPMEDSNVHRFVTLPHETFAGDALRHSSEAFKKDFNSILADVALGSTEIPPRIADRVADFDKSWKESQKMTLMRLRGIKEECPPLMESLRPLLDAARRVDALLAKIKKEEKNLNKVNIFGKKKTVDLTKLEQLKSETSEAVIEMDNLKDTVKAQ